MTFDLDRLQRRTLAVAVALVVVLLAAEILIVPVISYFRSAADDREQSLRQLAKLQTLVDSAPAMQQALAQIDAHPIWQHVYPSGASADLQQDFRALADAQKITLDSVQPIDPANGGDFDRIGLRVSFNTTIDHLSRLLLAMRSAPHGVHFENLYITSPMAQNAGENAQLMVRGDVVGLSRPAGKP